MIALCADDNSLLQKIATTVRNYRGITRKSSIALALPMFNLKKRNIIAAKGEDAAIVRSGDRMLALAVDGIMQELIEKNPHWAGYCSILANVNDMLAMNAAPIAAVNVVSIRTERTARTIIRGICSACSKFGVPMVGGHLHPDASFDSISVAMLGEVQDGKPLLSDSSWPGDRIVMICDCHGRFTAGIPYSWDCTSMKSQAAIKKNIKDFLGVVPYLTAGKDISNSGTLGSLAMLLEASRVGAQVDIQKILLPEGVSLLQCLNAYQGFGFVGSVKEKHVRIITDLLADSRLSISIIGEITADKKLIIRSGKRRKLLFDFSRDKITGLF
mgnify:CR=1 FL=1